MLLQKRFSTICFSVYLPCAFTVDKQLELQVLRISNSKSEISDQIMDQNVDARTSCLEVFDKNLFC